MDVASGVVYVGFVDVVVSLSAAPWRSHNLKLLLCPDAFFSFLGQATFCSEFSPLLCLALNVHAQVNHNFSKLGDWPLSCFSLPECTLHVNLFSKRRIKQLKCIPGRAWSSSDFAFIFLPANDDRLVEHSTKYYPIQHSFRVRARTSIWCAATFDLNFSAVFAAPTTSERWWSISLSAINTCNSIRRNTS